MSDLVSIAGAAVSAYQRALGTVSNNIANVDSEGYTRQDTALVENAPQQYGSSFLGTGVNVAGVQRAYDAFVESSLRTATTEAGTQEPLVTYANRVTDVIGSQDVGLLSAFDQFFDAARQLATDSSSAILREQFLSKTDSLAQRFNTLNGQLGLVGQETQEAINSQTKELNSLAGQLAAVNKQLSKNKSVDRQPPDLLDQRDLLLRKMSAIAKIQVSTRTNGEVSVSLGSTANKGVILDRDTAQPLSAIFNDSAVGKVDLVLRAGSATSEPITGFSGGSLSGLLSFRSQVLQPVLDDLDHLAGAVAGEVNRIQSDGVDLQGHPGRPLLKIDPQFSLSVPLGSTAASVSASLSDTSAYQSNMLRLDFDANAGQTSVIGLSGSFSVGDRLNVSLNGASKSFSLTTPPSPRAADAPDAPAMTINEVKAQLRQFLEGGNSASVDGVFGRQITVSNGPGSQLLVTSGNLSSFAFSAEVSGASSGGISNLTEKGRWTVTDTVTGQKVLGTASAEINGIRISLGGAPKNGETLYLKMQNSASAGLKLATQDASQIAAASRFRVIDSQFNTSSAKATLTETPEDFSSDASLMLNQLVGPAPAFKTLVSSDIVDNALRYGRVPVTPLAVVPAGYRDVTFYLSDLGQSATELQVLTRDGRHIVGRPLADDLIASAETELGRSLSEDERAALVDQAGEDFVANAKQAGVNFVDGSTYSAEALNGQGADAYRGMDVFYGVIAKVQEIPQLTQDHVVGSIKTVPASVTGFDAPQVTAKLGDTIFKEGELTLNGQSLPGLKLMNVGGVATLQLLKTDMNGVQQATSLPLGSLAGPKETSSGSGQFTITPDHLALWLSSVESPGTSVSVVPIANDVTHPGAIRYGLQISRSLDTTPAARPEDSQIRLGLGDGGTSLSLSKLGFRTTVTLSGEVKEDLYLFATNDNSAASFSLNATFTEGSRDPVASLRNEPFEVVFTSDHQYQIVDTSTNTVVADRAYDPAQGIVYRGVSLSLDNPPAAGDRFSVDGNQDGVGNNTNILRLAALQTQRLSGPGGTTLAESYSNTVSKAGNIAYQASISKKALDVVKDQAVQARDQVSGVSLDAEAADLIRFQQAYQASAKVMQTASTLFDSILQVR